MRRKSEPNAKIDALKARINKLNEEVKQASQEALSEGFVEIFKIHPTLVSCSWNQYTPYFNDGDECTFTVNTDYLFPLFEGDDPNSHEQYDEYNPEDRVFDKKLIKYVDKEVSPEKKIKNAAFYDLIDLISAIDESVMKIVYGNHVTVVISKQEDGTIKVDTEEFEHE